MDWHLLSTEEVVRKLDVNPETGLSDSDVTRRRDEHGLNELAEGEKRSPFSIIWDQLSEIMVVILVIAAVVSAALGEYLDAVVILAIIILNTILGFVQEYRAEQAMNALKQMAAPNVKVRRNGMVSTIPAQELVPGDIILLEAGDAVSADSRLIEVANLRIQEASLTGESEPIGKNTKQLSGSNIPLGDRKNMIYMGTNANYGRGTAIVAETGMQTELGNIAQLIHNVESEPTPLQRRMAQLGKTLSIAILGIIILVIVLGLLTAPVIDAEHVKELFLTAVAMAVAAIPEGLAAIVTIALALGAQKMLGQNALIRKLPAVETLGSVTTICSDKTGTLTQNRMSVQILDMADEKISLEGQKENGVPVFKLVEGQEDVKTLEMTLVAGALCNDAIIQHHPEHPSEWQTIGDPTEAALLVAAEAYNLHKDKLNKLFPRVAEIPFSSDRKRMTTIHKITEGAIGKIDINAVDDFGRFEGRYVAFSKGALSRILEQCSQLWVHDEVVELTDEWRARVIKSHDKMAAQGLRVLGVALRILNEVPESDEGLEKIEADELFVGIVGMMDPPRPEVKLAVQECLTAGIRPVMITGDHPITAKEIAKQLNIAKEGDRVVTGQELAVMSMEELEELVEHVPVFARVAPEHKLNIVQALQNRGHIVAMTGDGVNDAPALRKSDIGVAMGITGTDVSKEAAEMVLLDDNFATIVGAVKEGRTIYDNVRKFLQYMLTSNAGEIYVMIFPSILALLALAGILPEMFKLIPLPLVPLQILWINLVTDGLPGLALSVEPSEKDTMTRAPFAPDESIFSRGIGTRILWAGLLMGIISFAIGLWGFMKGFETIYWRTLVFNTLTLSQMGNALAIRSNRESIFTIGLRSNMMLVYAVIVTFILQIAVIYVPFLQNIFKTTSLTMPHMIGSLLLSTVVFWAIELEKLVKRRSTN